MSAKKKDNVAAKAAESPKASQTAGVAKDDIRKGVFKTPKGLSTAVVERKVTRDEVIQLQKDGRLVEFDPATQIGKVREVGHPTRWPGGACEADRSLA